MIERVLNDLVDGTWMAAELLVLIRTTLILGVGLLLVRGLRALSPAWKSLILRALLACAAVVGLLSLMPAPSETADDYYGDAG